MNKRSLALIALSTVLGLPAFGVLAQPESATMLTPTVKIGNQLVLGRTENVYCQSIPELRDVPFIGKIDTGADTTSMHAEKIHVTSENPAYQHLQDDALLEAVVVDMNHKYDYWTKERLKPYRLSVTFQIRHPYTGKAITVTRDVVRISMIRSRSRLKPILRPTISIPLTIAGKSVETDVNLADRSTFSAPILIGKTFLRNNAWVMAGYDYLQTLSHAQLIGNHEVVEVGDVPYQTSLSLKNNYSIAHAKQIHVDETTHTVSFRLEGVHGQQQAMTLPLVKMLRVSGTERPLVNLPVTLNDHQKMHWLAYLDDRSKASSQLRIGLKTLSQHFLIKVGADALLNTHVNAASTAAHRAMPTPPLTTSDSTEPLVVSPQERLQFDGFTLPAEPSLTVLTPVLRVHQWQEIRVNGERQVQFELSDSKGNLTTVTKPLLRRIHVGETMRPVIEGELLINGQTHTQAVALDELAPKERAPYLILGRKLSEGEMWINTRTNDLLNAAPLLKAGHIEVAQVEGMRFPVKLDTGADISSINAQRIKTFQRNGKPMVSFTYENDLGMQQRFTREVVDTMRIRAREGEEASERLVVQMTVRLGELEKTINVNLKDRSRFHYSMILGKNFLKYGVMVSSDHDFIATPKPDYEASDL